MSWVSGSYGSQKLIGHMGHGSNSSDPWSITYIAKRLYVILAPSFEYKRYFDAFSARNISTTSRNKMYPEAVEAISVVLKGYKTGLK